MPCVVDDVTGEIQLDPDDEPFFDMTECPNQGDCDGLTHGLTPEQEWLPAGRIMGRAFDGWPEPGTNARSKLEASA